MKRVLIVGGSFFLGRVFVEELLKRGDFSITVLNRGKLPLKKDRVEEIVCDRHDLDRLKTVLAGTWWDSIIDFCAYTPDDIDTMFQTSVGFQIKRNDISGLN